MSGIRSRALVVVAVGVAAATALAVALLLFQPWKLFVDTTVSEASPLDRIEVVEPAVTPGAESTPVTLPTAASPVPASSVPVTKVKEAAVVAEGAFVSHEHGTSGSASVIVLGDGRRILRLADLDTSNGPDLRVWLSDADVVDGTEGWFVFDDGDYADLGALKGNKGSQNYVIPDDVDLEDLTSVSVWCARFKVSFGAAELVPVDS